MYFFLRDRSVRNGRWAHTQTEIGTAKKRTVQLLCLTVKLCCVLHGTHGGCIGFVGLFRQWLERKVDYQQREKSWDEDDGRRGKGREKEDSACGRIHGDKDTHLGRLMLTVSSRADCPTRHEHTHTTNKEQGKLPSQPDAHGAEGKREALVCNVHFFSVATSAP